MSTNIRDTRKLPKAWIGYLIPAVLISEEVAVLPHPTPAEKEILIAHHILGVLIGVAYWLFCVYRMHRVLSDLTNRDYPIGPRSAVGRHLIPFYGQFYWIFLWPNAVATFVNSVTPQKIMSKNRVGLFLLGAELLLPFDIDTSLVIIFSVLVFLNRKIEYALDGRQEYRFANSWPLLKVAALTGASVGSVIMLTTEVMNLLSNIEVLMEFLADAALTFIAIAALEGVVIPELREVFGLGTASHEANSLAPPAIGALFFVGSYLLIEMEREAVRNHTSAASLLLFQSLILSGLITYFWMCGARFPPPRAARFGALAGCIASMSIGFWWIQMGWKMNVYGDQLPLTWMTVVANAATWTGIGFVGGLVIDRSQSEHPSRIVAGVLLTVPVLFGLLMWFIRLAINSQPNWIGIVATNATWSAALVVYPPVDRYLRAYRQ